MPCISRLLRHVDGISRPEPQQQIPLPILFFVSFRVYLWQLPIRPSTGSNHEQAITPDTQTNETAVRLLTHIPMHHHRVPGAVEVDNGSLGARLGPQLFEEAGNVLGEGGWPAVRVDPVCPVVLAAEGDPVELLGEDAAGGLGLVSGGVFGGEEGVLLVGGGGGIGGEGEEGGLVGRVGEVEV